MLLAEIDAVRSELEKQKSESSDLMQELNAVSHHRTVLRDTVDQLEKKIKEQADLIGSLQTQLERAGGDFLMTLDMDTMDISSPIQSPLSSPVNSPNRRREPSHRHQRAEEKKVSNSDDEDALRRQAMRFKARASAMEELASLYRTSVLALYADGASYGAAQFGWQPHGLPQEFNKKGLHLIGVGWIEREMNIVKHSFEDEIRNLDAENADLRSKLRQSNSQIIELRQSFETNVKNLYG